jgi:hypothetical protein
MRFVLRQNADAQVSGIDQIGQHEIDQSVGTAEGNCGLCSVGRQRIEPLAFPSGQDDAEDVWQLPHDSNLSAVTDGDQAFALLKPRDCRSSSLVNTPIGVPYMAAADRAGHYGRKHAGGDDDA